MSPRHSLLAVAAALILLAVPTVPAQTTPQPQGSIAAHAGWPQPAPADVASPEALVAAVYSVISGPKDAPRDWNRMRSLFLPDARLLPTRELPGSPDSSSPNTDVIPLTIDGYIARATARTAAAGFYERGTTLSTQHFGNIVHIWSAYESRHAATDPTPFATGVNSFQILKDGNRYWVVNIFWDAAAPPK